MFNRYFQLNQIFIDPETRTVVAMTPKVMTKFIRSTLNDGYAKHQGRTHPSNGRYRFVALSRKFPLAPPGAYVDALLRPERYAAYGFARNPYARLHSAWRNKFDDFYRAILEGARLDYPQSIRGGELPRLRRFAAAHELPGAKIGSRVPFATFARYAVSQPDRARDRHWRGQAPMLQLDHFREMRLHRVEDGVAAPLTEVFTRLGFAHDWIERRLSRPRNVSSRGAENPYDEALAAIVHDGFEEDFRRLGYDRDSWRSL
ncbi:MAG: sulfotransferase family 2 domain-containing protein [Pseudomonadota bacterium]